MSDDCWVKVLDGTSTREDLEQSIRAHVAQCIADFALTLEADHPNLSERDRFALIARATLVITTRTRESFEAAWERLQQEADTSSTTVVH